MSGLAIIGQHVKHLSRLGVAPFALAAAVFLLPQGALAEEVEEPCTWDSAERYTIAELDANWRELMGACVIVPAIHVFDEGARDFMFPQLREELEQSGEWENMRLPSRLYADRQAIERGGAVLGVGWGSAYHGEHPVQAEAVLGRFRSCVPTHDWVAQRQYEEPERIVMASGFCHGWSGHYLDVTDAREGPDHISETASGEANPTEASPIR